MNIIVNIKPKIVKGKTKSELMNKVISGYIYCHTDSSNGYVKQFCNKPTHKKTIRVFNIQRFRPKWKEVAGQKHKTKVREGYWIAYVYDMPKFISVSQATPRNFRIKGVSI